MKRQYLNKLTQFLVTNPDGLSRVKCAETRFHAIAMCIENDNNKFRVNEYKTKRCR